MIQLVAGLLALLLCVVAVLPILSDRLSVVADGLAVALFSDFVDTGRRRRRRVSTLDAAHVHKSYDIFAPQTVLYAVLGGLITGAASVAIVPSILAALATPEGTLLMTLPPAILAVDWSALSIVVLVTTGVSLLGAVSVAVLLHELRWFVLGQRAYSRATRIEATLPRTVAFMYALSRSGMAFPQILRILSEHEAVYGEAANEISITVRDIDVFGTDVVTALERTSERTPSDNMAELTDNLASVLASGQNLPEYLKAQYERYKEEAESQQQQYLDLLAAFAEAYVTVLVVGPLFLITILAVIGLVIQDTLTIMRVITFVGIPLVTAAFVIYVDSMTTSLQAPDAGNSREQEALETVGQQPETITDGGYDGKWAEQYEALIVYDRLEQILSWVREPINTLFANPWLTGLITIPLGLVWLGLEIRQNHAGVVGFYVENAVEAIAVFLSNPNLVRAEELIFSAITAVDKVVVEVLIIVCFAYAVVYEVDKRRTRKIEIEIPDFLDRFASLNQAGMSAIAAFRRVSGTDLGKLSPELTRTMRDIQWGAEIEMALERMDRRVRSALVTRAVTLVTNALRTSGDIAPVLSIAADEVRASRLLNRERKQAMLTYLIVIYIAFLVFLGIVVVLTISFIPAIEETGQQVATDGATADPVPTVGGLGQFEQVDIGAYESLFFHLTIIQAICSGLVGGQLGGGGIRDGVKHTGILLVLTYVTFSLI